VITTGEDGLIYIHLIDKENLSREATFYPLADIEGIDYMPEATREELKQEKTKEFFEENPPYFAEVDHDKDALDHSYLTKTLKLSEEVNEDITDSSQYSIQ